MNSIDTLSTAASNFSKQGMFHTLTDLMFNQINDSTSVRAIVNGVLGDYLADSLTLIPGGKTTLVVIVS